MNVYLDDEKGWTIFERLVWEGRLISFDDELLIIQLKDKKDSDEGDALA